MKNKALSIAAAVLAVVMLGSGAFYFVKCRGAGKNLPAVGKKEITEYSYDASAYTAAVKKASDAVLLPCGIDGMYYSADLEGNVKFYTYSNGEFSNYAGEVKTVSVKAGASRETIPVTLSYIEQGSKICGFGVFTADMDSSVEVYPYAFFKLINMPAGYGGGYLLMADFEKENFFSADKIYSELYSLNLATGKASKMVSELTRTIDYMGAYRNDWSMLTDDFIASMGNSDYFLSSRYYDHNLRGLLTDIMVMSSSYEPKIKSNGVLGMWASVQADGLHYIRGTAMGFDSVVLTDSERVISSFEGDYFNDYLADGNYIINKKSLVLTNLLTGESKTLSDINIEGADVFSLSPDGKYAVFACNGEENTQGALVQTVIYCTVDGSVKPVSFVEPLLFSESADSFTWLEGSAVMSHRAADGTGSQVCSVIYRFA